MLADCKQETPDDLKEAICDVAKMQAWVKIKSAEELLKALDWVYLHKDTERVMIKEEIAYRQYQQLNAHLIELRKPHWTVIPTFWLVIAALIVSLGAVFISWIALHQPVPSPAAASNNASTQSKAAYPSPMPATVIPTSSATPTPATPPPLLPLPPPKAQAPVIAPKPAPAPALPSVSAPASTPTPQAPPTPKQP